MRDGSLLPEGVTTKHPLRLSPRVPVGIEIGCVGRPLVRVRPRAWLVQEAADPGGDVRRAAVVDEHDSLAGESSTEIAAALGPSSRTVEGHRRMVLRKMELSSAAALAGLLSRSGA